jgi:hypothetical protein
LACQILQSIRATQQSPSSIASIAFDKAVFGKHPYAHETIGTQAVKMLSAFLKIGSLESVRNGTIDISFNE